jgi:hypothetical protein
MAPDCQMYYNGFGKRLEAYKKQLGIPLESQTPISKIQINSHLIPTNTTNCRQTTHQADLKEDLHSL